MNRTLNMIFVVAGIVAFLAAVSIVGFAQSSQSVAWDVPAMSYTIPAPYPCNLNHSEQGMIAFTNCVTGPETRWKCSDPERVLLTSGDGRMHCILFPPQEHNSPTLYVRGEAAATTY